MKRLGVVLGCTALITLASVLPAQAGTYGDNLTQGFYSSYTCSGWNLVPDSCYVKVSVPGPNGAYIVTTNPTKSARIRYCDAWGVRDNTILGAASGISKLKYGAPIAVLWSTNATKVGAINCK